MQFSENQYHLLFFLKKNPLFDFKKKMITNRKPHSKEKGFFQLYIEIQTLSNLTVLDVGDANKLQKTGVVSISS